VCERVIECEVAWEIHFSRQPAIPHMVIFQGQVIHWARALIGSYDLAERWSHTHIHTHTNLLTFIPYNGVNSWNLINTSTHKTHTHTLSLSLCSQNFETLDIFVWMNKSASHFCYLPLRWMEDELAWGGQCGSVVQWETRGRGDKRCRLSHLATFTFSHTVSLQFCLIYMHILRIWPMCHCLIFYFVVAAFKVS